MPNWLPWLIAAGLLGLVELHTLTLVLGMLSIAAIPAAGVAAAGGSPALQVLVFAIASVLTVGVVRPIARRHREQPNLLTGAAAIVGQRGTVTVALGDDSGRVRIGGEVWSARSYVEDQQLPAGTVVDVVGIDGATAIVLARDFPQVGTEPHRGAS